MTDNTWYDKGYNEGYEAAAKVAREQYALVNMWSDKVATLNEENARLRAALLPFAAIYAAYQRDYNSDRDKAAFYATINNEANWFSIWMHHDGYKSVKEADYQQAAAVLADVEVSSTTQETTE